MLRLHFHLKSSLTKIWKMGVLMKPKDKSQGTGRKRGVSTMLISKNVSILTNAASLVHDWDWDLINKMMRSQRGKAGNTFYCGPHGTQWTLSLKGIAEDTTIWQPKWGTWDSRSHTLTSRQKILVTCAPHLRNRTLKFIIEFRVLQSICNSWKIFIILH